MPAHPWQLRADVAAARRGGRDLDPGRRADGPPRRRDRGSGQACDGGMGRGGCGELRPAPPAGPGQPRPVHRAGRAGLALAAHDQRDHHLLAEGARPGLDDRRGHSPRGRGRVAPPRLPPLGGRRPRQGRPRPAAGRGDPWAPDAVARPGGHPAAGRTRRARRRTLPAHRARRRQLPRWLGQRRADGQRRDAGRAVDLGPRIRPDRRGGPAPDRVGLGLRARPHRPRVHRPRAGRGGRRCAPRPPRGGQALREQRHADDRRDGGGGHGCPGRQRVATDDGRSSRFAPPGDARAWKVPTTEPRADLPPQQRAPTQPGPPGPCPGSAIRRTAAPRGSRRRTPTRTRRRRPSARCSRRSAPSGPPGRRSARPSGMPSGTPSPPPRRTSTPTSSRTSPRSDVSDEDDAERPAAITVVHYAPGEEPGEPRR